MKSERVSDAAVSGVNDNPVWIVTDSGKCARTGSQQRNFSQYCRARVMELVADEFGIEIGKLMKQGRGVECVCRARQVCMYLLHTSLSFNYLAHRWLAASVLYRQSHNALASYCNRRF